MKTKILNWIKTTQKATAAALGAASMLAAASFVPEPYKGWAAGAVIILTWVVTYAVPFVTQMVETAPIPDVAPVTGEVIEPETTEIPIVVPDTNGIPVVEGADSGTRPYPGPTVDQILNRLAAEQSA